MALRRARVDVEKAEEALAVQRRADETDLKIMRISVEKLQPRAEGGRGRHRDLTLRSTVAGTVILGDHPEERRKLQETDDVFMGMTLARVASSNARRVRAWLVDVDDGKIAVGMPARVTLDAYPARVFTGVVRDISPVARAPGEYRAQAQRRVFTVGVELGDADAQNNT